MKTWYQKSSEGMEEYCHPFFDTHSLYRPERRSRIFIPNDQAKPIQVLANQLEEKYCAFCMGRIQEATPEKSRIVEESGLIRTYSYPRINTVHDNNILFRRQGNLFEIISFSYWKEKYGIDSSPEEKIELEKAFSIPEEKEVIEDLLRLKLMRIQKDSDSLSLEELKKEAQPFYSGFHEILTSGFHYLSNASKTSDLFSSGNMGWKNHRISYQSIVQIINDMITRNKYIRFIAIFQNWLLQAGASFEHWHKQILALDFWGRPLEREAKLFINQFNIYEQFGLGTALAENLVIAENDYAIAYIEIGAKTGYVTICSKSSNIRPNEHTLEEINGMSDLVHAMAYCLGVFTPYNEEWFYTPFDTQNFRTPWRVILNIRTNTSAGLENITQIAITPISASELAHAIRIRLETAISENKINPDIISNPLYVNAKNILKYY